jgi:DNA recombination protein RmuC
MRARAAAGVGASSSVLASRHNRRMVYVLAVLLALALVALALLARHILIGSRTSVLDPTEREQLAEAMRADVLRLQEQVQSAGVAQLVAQNKALLSQETARGEEQLKARQEEIDRAVGEVRRELEGLRKFVREVDEQRGRSIVALESVTRESGRQTELLRQETKRLNEVLSGAQSRGQWGERMAEDVLRLAGMIEGVQYEKQRALGEGARPDFTFLIEGKRLNMDVKTPMAHYQRYLAAASQSERAEEAKAFRADVRRRIGEVRSREYINPEAGTLDYVLVFIPNEQVYAFLHENDPELIDEALAQRVVLCSPLTLFAVLAVIRQAAKNFRFAKRTDEVLRTLGAFAQEWQKFKEQMNKLERALESARRAFDVLASTRTRQLDRRLEKIGELDAERAPAAGSPLQALASAIDEGSTEEGQQGESERPQ